MGGPPVEQKFLREAAEGRPADPEGRACERQSDALAILRGILQIG